MTFRSILILSAIVIATGCSQKGELPIEAKKVGLHSFKAQCVGFEPETVSLLEGGFQTHLNVTKT